MDGFEEPYWNLIQTLGWVYRRDREWVRRAGDEVTDHGTFPQEMQLPDGRVELVATPAGPPSDLKLEIAAALAGDAAYQTVGDAESALLTVLRHGRLNALGLENNKGDIRGVPTVQWADLIFYFDPPRAGPLNIARTGATHWHGLKFSRSEVLEIWPDPAQSVVVDPTGRPTFRAQILEAFFKLSENGEVDFDAPMVKLYEPIRQMIRDQTGDQTLIKSLGKEAIRKVISTPFATERAKQKNH